MHSKNSRLYRTLVLISFVFLVNDGFSQRIISQENTAKITDFSFMKLAVLPHQINEASGLENCGDSIYWTHNDGGIPVLYGLNEKGAIVRTVHLKNKNRGWEDLSFDANHNLYIAATGNNSGTKEHLKIYKIPNPNTITSPITLAESITFTYEGQLDSDGNLVHKNYDSDALLAIGDSLYIFTKNRSIPNDGMIYIFSLPNRPGEYVAKKVDSFMLVGAQFDNWITGVDMTDDGELIAILFHQKVLFIEKTEDMLFSEGTFTWLNLGHFSHKAGIVVKDRNTVYIVDERELDILGGDFYRLNLQYFKN